MLAVLVLSGLLLVAMARPAQAAQRGLRISYFSETLAVDPDVSLLEPCVRTTGIVDFDWGSAAPGPGCPEDGFSTHARGWIRSPRTGDVTFCISSDDGARLEVGGTLLVNALDLGHGPETCNYTVSHRMVAFRWYPIDLFHNEFGGGAALRLKWTLPDSDDLEIVPASALRTSKPDTSDGGAEEAAPVPAGVPSGTSPSPSPAVLPLVLASAAVFLAGRGRRIVRHAGG